jgi:hypothetical protein
MEVPFSSFHIPHVPNLIKIETDVTKNKGRKTHGANMYLTLFFTSSQKKKKKPSNWHIQF